MKAFTCYMLIDYSLLAGVEIIVVAVSAGETAGMAFYVAAKVQ